MIVVMAGLPGTGKSTLARALATRTGGAVIGKDEVRAALFAPEDLEYSTEQDDFCMDVMLEAAKYLLRKHPDRFVLIDGRTFSQRYQIERVLEFAAQMGQPWRILECVCSERTARARLESQVASGEHLAANRDFPLYARVKKRFEEVRFVKTVIDTDLPIEACIAQSMEALSK